MERKKNLFTAFFFLFFPLLCFCRDGRQFNINIHNGLPSNNVYNVLKDHYGYLWIATDNGVLKYNGYSFKLFNQHNGLPNADVWSLYEDRSGRIWLGSITDEIGYLYKDRYSKAAFPGVDHTLYPVNFMPYKDGVFFSTPYIRGIQQTLCVAIHDTVYADSNAYPSGADTYVTPDFPILIYGNKIYALSVAGRRFYSRPLATISQTYPAHPSARNKTSVTGNYLLTYKKKDDGIYLLNVHNGKVSYCRQPQTARGPDLLNYVYTRTDGRYPSQAYTIADSFIYIIQLSATPYIRRRLRIDSLVQAPGNSIVAIYEDTTWNCIATSSKGLFISYGAENYFEKKDFAIEHSRFAGMLSDGSSFWWNAARHCLTGIRGGKQVSIRLPSADAVTDIIEKNKDTALVLNNGDAPEAWLIKGKTIIPVLPHRLYAGRMRMINYKPGETYCISGYGFTKLKFGSSVQEEQFLDRDRYRSLVYDSMRQAICAYNFNKTFIHRVDGRDIIVRQAAFGSLGIKRLEKILTDRYGNIYLKDYDRLVVYDLHTGNCTGLLKHYNLNEATIYLYSDVLVVAGRFGVIFDKIAGPHRLYKPYLCPNTRNMYYSYITGACVNEDGILLNTERGPYHVAFPPATAMCTGNDSAVLHQQRFLLRYHNELRSITGGDTLVIYPGDRSIQFDVINPLGNGPLFFEYMPGTKGTWTAMNANELHADKLEPGRYTDLSLIASDNVWRSDVLHITLYLHPYWWQTASGKEFIIGGTAIITILLLVAAILITRKIILKKNNRKHHQLELELKAIYAQINPHFIFNTLGSAMLLIRQQRITEAYTHVGRFSQLLRSYLNSARNRYISLTEETENLETYIRLQQARFPDKFHYTIDIGNTEELHIHIPSLLLQPIVENAINHGLFHKQGTGHLNISFYLENNRLLCVIDDDGIGRSEAAALYEKSQVKKQSYGSKLVEELVTIYNRYEDLSIEIVYTDKPGDTGTKVKVIINNIRYEQRDMHYNR